MTDESWVARRLGVRLTLTPAAAVGGHYGNAVELGLRRNPNRAQLLVSRLLGKHIPVPISEVLDAGHALGALVRDACAGRTPVVVGFAETATGLGHAVAAVASTDGASAPYFHTTRRTRGAGVRAVTFLEEHSHATDQALVVCDDTALRTDAPLVLVDDELSTGRTVTNAIQALHGRWPRRRYVVASLVDARPTQQHADVAARVEALDGQVRSVSLLSGELTLPADVLARADTVLAALPLPRSPQRQRVRTCIETLALALGVPATAAWGWTGPAEAALRAAADGVAASLPIHHDERTLVLGDEEFMYFPQLVAAALGRRVHTSTTTRSPAAVIDEPGYPLRTALVFAATNDPARPAYAYNVAASANGDNPGNAPGFDDILFVTDTVPAAHVCDGLLAQLSRVARRSVHVLAVTGEGSDPPC